MMKCTTFAFALLACTASTAAQQADSSSVVVSAPPSRSLWGNSCAYGSGILSDDTQVCCSNSCGSCGGSTCSTRPGGASNCCKRNIRLANKTCAETGGKAPCLMVQNCSNNGGCQNGSQCVLNWKGLIWCKNCPEGCWGDRCEQGWPSGGAAPQAPEVPPAPPAPLTDAAAPVPEPLAAPTAVAPVQAAPPAAAASTGSAVTADEQAAIMNKHNDCRAKVSPPAAQPIPGMVWDATVAASAQAYADTCPSGHAAPDQYGENLAWGAPSMSAVIAVNGWADEVSQYSYNGNSCSGVCGHYTQMIWADTTKVGCGTAKCGNLSILGNEAGQVWVCRYSKPGNYVGTLPYVAARRLATDGDAAAEIVTSSTTSSHKLANWM